MLTDVGEKSGLYRGKRPIPLFIFTLSLVIVQISIITLCLPHGERASSALYFPSPFLLTLIGYSSVCLSVLVGILSLMTASWYLGSATKAEEIPRSKIRSASQGYSQFQGRQYSIPGEKCVTPYAQEPCTWFHFTLEKEHRTEFGARVWLAIESYTSSKRFLFKDETGECYIDPRHAKMVGQRERVFLVEGKPLDLFRNNKTYSFPAGKYRITEHYFKSGDDLYLVGGFHTITEIGLLKKSKRSVSRILDQWTEDYQTLWQSYFPEGNEEDLGLFEQKRQTVETEIRKKYPKLKGTQLHLISHQGVGAHQSFILSLRDEDKAIERDRLTTKSFVVLFLLTVGWVVTLFPIFERYNQFIERKITENPKLFHQVLSSF